MVELSMKCTFALGSMPGTSVSAPLRIAAGLLSKFLTASGWTSPLELAVHSSRLWLPRGSVLSTRFGYAAMPSTGHVLPF